MVPTTDETMDQGASMEETWELHDEADRNRIQYIIVSKKFSLKDVVVAPKFYKRTYHHLHRGTFSFTRKAVKAAKPTRRSPENTIDGDLYCPQTDSWEVMNNINEYDRAVEHLHDSTRKMPFSILTPHQLRSVSANSRVNVSTGAVRAASNRARNSRPARVALPRGDERRLRKEKSSSTD
ncbi:hypothetical protein RB195_026286 [Necator americanus]|uniref:Uncharacterized protein n=1 Tax=Necator americanus TaxID=51031 RepID=A0ABR1EW85_NECAM